MQTQEKQGKPSNRIEEFIGCDMAWAEGDEFSNEFLRALLPKLFPELLDATAALPVDIENLLQKRNPQDDWYYESKRDIVKSGDLFQFKEIKKKKRFSEELAKLIIKRLNISIEGEDDNSEKQKRLLVLFNELTKIKTASEYEPPKLHLDETKFARMIQNIDAVYHRAMLHRGRASSDAYYSDLWLAKQELLDDCSDGIDAALAHRLFELVFPSGDEGVNYEALYQIAALALLVTIKYEDGLPTRIERCGSGYGHAEACAGGCIGCSFSPDNFDDPKVLTRPPSIPPEIMVADALWKIKYRGLDHYKIVMGVGELYYESTAFRDAIKVIRSSNRLLARELGEGKRTTCASLGVINDDRIAEALSSEGIHIEHYNSNFERPAVYYDGKACGYYEDGSSLRVAPFAAHHDFAAKVYTYKIMQQRGIKSCSGALVERVFPEVNDKGARLLKVTCDDGREFSNQLAPYIDLFTTIKELGLESSPFNARVNIIDDHLTQDLLKEEEYITLLSLFKLIHTRIKRIILNAGPESGGSFLPIAMRIGGGISSAGNYLTSGVTEAERERMEELLSKFAGVVSHAAT